MGGVEEIKGKLKEAAGDVTGSDDLRAEGQAQQEKGQQQTQADELRAKAAAHDTQADEADQQEQTHQGT